MYIGHQRSVALVPYHTPLRSASEQTITAEDIGKLLNQLNNFSDKWFDIGMGLGFAPSELNLIKCMESLFNDAPVSYFTKLLSQWVQWPTAEHPTKPTLESLCMSLRRSIVGLGSLADKLEEDIKSLGTSKCIVAGHRHIMQCGTHTPMDNSTSACVTVMVLRLVFGVVTIMFTLLCML